MADMKTVGAQTAAGYARSNVPIPSNTHQPFPASPVPDGVPSVDSSRIAPTSGPAGDAGPASPQDELQFEVDRCPPGAGAPHDRLQFEVDQCPERP